MNINQFLIIHKFPVLFSILDEIKSNLNFNIHYLDNEKFHLIASDQNLVVISGEKKIIFKNKIKIDKYPINIQKIIEIINIQFLKNKFIQQNDVKVGNYSINLNSRAMYFEDKSIQLTEKEVKIIIFLKSLKVPVPISKLQSEVWGYKSKLETHTVETHVYRLRKKVEKEFKDKSFIISLKNGYKIQA